MTLARKQLVVMIGLILFAAWSVVHHVRVMQLPIVLRFQAGLRLESLLALHAATAARSCSSLRWFDSSRLWSSARSGSLSPAWPMARS